MGARACVGARWWGGTYKPRPPYAFPVSEPLTWLPMPAATLLLEDVTKLVRVFWATLLPGDVPRPG